MGLETIPGDIGDKINTIIAELAKANNLVGVIDEADFNDDENQASVRRW